MSKFKHSGVPTLQCIMHKQTKYYKLINIIITLKLNNVEIYFCTYQFLALILEFGLWFSHSGSTRVMLLQVGTRFPII